MRFIIREQDYEELVASGRFRYEKNGQPTGATESWRLTKVISGYCFVRVDLDGQDAESKESVLYHLVLAPDGTPERLKYIYFKPGGVLRGDVQLAHKSITNGRSLNGERHHETLDLPGEFAFWFPSTIGLSMLLKKGTSDNVLDTVSPDRASSFQLSRKKMTIRCAQEEHIVVINRQLLVRPCSIHWDNETRELWLDEYSWPVKLRRNDGLTAIETQYVRCL